MKDNLPFFSHDNDARQHPKMKALMAKFGFEGYGRFWALNERIAQSSGACIDISKTVYRLDLAQELGLDEKGFESFIGFLSDPEIDLININDNKITTDRITESFSRVMDAREYERNKKQAKKGKRGNPEGKDDFPEGNAHIPEGIPGEKDTYNIKEDKNIKDNIKRKDDGSGEPVLSESEKSAFELSETLLAAHRKEIPDYLSGKDKGVIPRWAKDIEKLIRIDKKPPEKIREVILWVKTPGNFWFTNIESGKKLREKFERLYGEMVQKGSTGPPKHRIAADYIPPDQASQYFTGG